MTFQELIQAEKAKLEGQDVVLGQIYAKKLEDAESEYKQASKNIRFQLKRLEAMLAIFQENENLFKGYTITKEVTDGKK